MKRITEFLYVNFLKASSVHSMNSLVRNLLTFLLKVNLPVRILILLLYIGSIAALSLLPPQDLPKVRQFPGFDKVVHFLMYFIFSILACWAIKVEHSNLRMALIIFGAAGWGIVMEILQLTMHSGRSFSYYDILANCIGVLSGAAIYGFVSLRYKPAIKKNILQN